MPEYRLHYINMRGLAECARQLFHLSSTPYEDIRHDPQEWLGQLKAVSAFNRLPFLDIDDKVLPQSTAINRYLAKQFGFAGKTPFDEARVDALADQFKDYWADIVPFTYSMYSKDKDPETFEQKKNEVAIPARDKLFRILEKEYKANGSTGFLVGDSLTWVDLLIADHMDVNDPRVRFTNPFSLIPLPPYPIVTLNSPKFIFLEDTPFQVPKEIDFRFYDDYPGMQQLKKNVSSMPKLKEWLEKRPQTKY